MSTNQVGGDLGEAFDTNRAIGFGFIWVALAIYAGNGLLHSRRDRAAARMPISSR